MSVFFVFITLVLTLGFTYLDLRLLKRLAANTRQRWALRLALGSILALQFVIQPLYRGQDLYTWSGLTWVLAWTAFTGLGLAAFLFILTFLFDLSWGGVRLGLLLNKKTQNDLPDPARRLFLGRQLPATIIGVSGVSTALGVANARIVPSVERVEIPLRGLPAEFDGFSFCQISDLHIGPTIGASFVDEVVARANAAGADAILLTGDIVDGYVHQLKEVHSKLGTLRAPEGVFFVAGNHEYFWNAEEWFAHYRSLGIHALMNEHRVIRRGAASIAIGGLPDIVGPRFVQGHELDLKKTFAGAPEQATRILLAHQPSPLILDRAVQHEVALQISGHTHAGQFYPFAFFVRLALPYVAGKYTHRSSIGSCELYVNRGTGYWGPPVRLGVKPEITQLVLRRTT